MLDPDTAQRLKKGDTLVCADPNRRNILTFMHRPLTEEELQTGKLALNDSAQLFRGAYYSVMPNALRRGTGAKETARRMDKAIKARGIHNKLSGLPTRRCHTPDQARRLLAARAEVLEAWCEARNSRTMRRRRMVTYSRRDRLEAKVCSQILFGPASTRQERRKFREAGLRVVVAFGDAIETCAGGKRGFAPSPLRRLLARLQALPYVALRFIDEYHTSKMCSCCCANELELVVGLPKLKPGQDPNTRRKPRPLWHLEVCSRCGLRMDRDANSCNNMMRKACAALSEEQRLPASLERPPPSTAAR